jgi:ferric-dicitrate binding protein FerR (iron transport regulator)
VEHGLNDIETLISKYLAGEASQDEMRHVELWLALSDENRRYFDQMNTVFARSTAIKDIHQFDTDAAWAKVRANLRKKSGNVRTLEPEQKSYAWIYGIAAGIILTIGVNLYFLVSRPSTTKPLEVIATQKTITDTLPDGSEVVLNKKTTLKYAFDKKKKVHEVKLKGEAYFNVKHEDDEGFLIDANGVFIKDIGTSFNVKAYPDTDLVEVVVEEGEVVIYTRENSGIHLGASGKGVYNRKTRTFSVEKPEPNVLAYKTRFFIFSGTELGEVANALNSVYDTKISVPQNLRKCELTVSFQDETIEEIAAIIAETLNLKVTQSGKFIQLEGQGCE